jgi:squalene-hopene/tetraprenyl-beta-curcumene cyclase
MREVVMRYLIRLNTRLDRSQTTVLLAILLATAGPALLAAEPPRPKPIALPGTTDVSLRHEVQHAIDRGLAALKAQQNPAGFWSSEDHPAITALALTAFQGEPTGRFKPPFKAELQRGFTFLIAACKPDGGIYKKDLANYNTAVSMMALLAAHQPEYDPVLRRARAFLVRSQVDLGETNKLDSPFDGGVGYGSKYNHSDLNNTLLALEALYYSKHLVADQSPVETRDLDWPAAIRFLQHCQNLPAHNPEPWASGDAQNIGGFIYYPGHSMAGGVTNSATGRVALRSYGSASYAGLLSYIYADVKRDDPRVVAVMEWLRGNYTLDENPGMGLQGLYYYLHTMTKALALYGGRELELKGGRKINWRQETALKLINLQQADGSWSNPNNRWWEKDPALATAYAVLALEIIHRGL